MATLINCPNCESPLQITPELYGKTVACPTCQATLKVPTPKSKPKPKPKPARQVKKTPPRPDPAPAPAPASSDNPFDFDGGASAPAAPATDANLNFDEPPDQYDDRHDDRDDYEDDYDDRAGRARPKGPALPRPWAKARLGLLIMGGGLLWLFLGVLIAGLTSPTKIEDSRGRSRTYSVNAVKMGFVEMTSNQIVTVLSLVQGRARVAPLAGAGKWILIIFTLLGAGAMGYGLFLCGSIPSPSKANRGFFLSGLLVVILAVCIFLAVMISGNAKSRSSAAMGGVLTFTSLVGWKLLLVLFFLSLVLLCQDLQAKGLRTIAILLLVFAIAFPNLSDLVFSLLAVAGAIKGSGILTAAMWVGIVLLVVFLGLMAQLIFGLLKNIARAGRANRLKAR